MKLGFDSKKYIKYQTKEIKNRLKKFDKIYLEIGGHLLKDYHAKRVLPGYLENNKIKVLKNFEDIEIIYCIYSKHITSTSKDYNSNKDYKKLIIKEINTIKKLGFEINSIVITRYENKKEINDFIKKLENKKLKVYKTYKIKEYPNNLKIILSKNGYLKQPYIKTKHKLNIVTGPIANSGKMGVCLSQIYHDTKNNIESGYLKYESFPVYNLNINHPVNIAYEAATADILDENQIDPYHKTVYNKEVVNYNRDIENFKILKKIISKITSNKNYMKNYKSPTDMGVNTIKKAIINNEIIKKASIKEINKRYKHYLKEYNNNREKRKTIKRMDEIFKKYKLKKIL